MDYLLVLLTPGPSHPGAPETDEKHEAFITELIIQNRILLGGNWNEAAGPFRAAYLLYCDSWEEGRAIVGRDPYVQEGVYEPTIVEWRLVGINTDAIKEDLILTRNRVETR